MMDLRLLCFTLLSVLSNFEVSTTVTIHSVGSLRDAGSLQCGSKVTFICTIPTYTYNMKWLIDSDTVAECTTTNCVQYPPYKVDNIEFSPDTSIGVFNMTMNPVTLKADGCELKCHYGSESVQLKLTVKVPSRRNTTEIVETKDEYRNMIRITAMTGCVFPSSALSIQWYYYEEDQASKLYEMTSANIDNQFSECSSETCGGKGEVKISSTLSIPDEQIGKDYFFLIVIRHEDTGDIMLVNSTRSYKLNKVSTTTVRIQSVGSLRDIWTVQCGSKVTFICSIPAYRYNMKWLIDFDKVAECTTTNCVQYPPYKIDNIEFSSDTSNGEFNMTINQVTIKADGRSIGCSYDSEVEQLRLAVKVLPRRNTTEIVEAKYDIRNMVNITAMTGCVFPSSALSMQWFYFEEGHTPKLYKKSSPIEASNSIVCSSGTCGGNGVVKLSSTLSIPDEQRGKGYFFQIAIRLEDTGDIILVNSTRSFKINVTRPVGDEEENKTNIGLIVGLPVCLLLAVLFAGVVIYVLYRKLCQIIGKIYESCYIGIL